MTDADKNAFRQVISRLAVALREPAPDVALMLVYFRALSAVEIELITAAADQLILESKWFPKTSEWLAAARKIETDRLAAMRKLLRDSPTPLCPACNDTGWSDIGPGLIETVHGPRHAPSRVRACDCLRLRRLEVLGRRPWPSLPAGVPDGEIDHSSTMSVLAMIEQRTGVKLRPKSMPTPRWMPTSSEDTGEELS